MDANDFLSVDDTLGLVLRVFVTAANVGEREGGKRVLKRVNQMGSSVSRLHTIWSMVGLTVSHSCGDGRLPLDCSGGVTTKANQRICLA